MFNNQSLFDRRMIVRMDKVPEDSAPPGPKLPSESLYLLYSPPHRCQFVSNPQLNPCSPPHRCQFVSIPQLNPCSPPHRCQFVSIPQLNPCSPPHRYLFVSIPQLKPLFPTSQMSVCQHSSAKSLRFTQCWGGQGQVQLFPSSVRTVIPMSANAVLPIALAAT